MTDSEKIEAEETTPEKRSPSLGERLLPFLVTAVVILLDQFSKRLIEANLPLYQSWAPIPAIENFFRITHATNTGAAFGLFPSGSIFFALMAVVVSIAIIYYNHTIAGGHWLLRVALGLQLGGAMGNLIDRARQGYVTDLLDFGPWPIFNFADMAIVGGVALLAWIMFQEGRREVHQTAEEQSDQNNQQLDEGPTN